MMSTTGKRVTVGLATLGLVGLAGGGIAWAATDSGSTAKAAAGSADHCGARDAKYSPMTAMAKYLGLTPAALATQMHSGKNLAAIAKAQGKSVAGLKAAAVSAMKRSLAADASLSAAQRTAILAVMKTHVDSMVTGAHPSGMDMKGMNDMGANDMGANHMGGMDDAGMHDSGGGMMNSSIGGMLGH